MGAKGCWSSGKGIKKTISHPLLLFLGLFLSGTGVVDPVRVSSCEKGVRPGRGSGANSDRKRINVTGK